MPGKMISDLKVKDAYQLLVEKPSTVTAGASLEEVLRAIVADHKTRHVYVVNKDGGLIGSIKLSGVIEYMFPESLFDTAIDINRESLVHFKKSLVAMDIMNRTPSYVTTEASLQEAVEIMKKRNIGELPVVDSQNRLIGEINILEVITSYLNTENT